MGSGRLVFWEVVFGLFSACFCFCFCFFADMHVFFFYTPGSSNIAGWKMDPLKMYFLLNMGIFHCYVRLPEGNLRQDIIWS